MCSSLSKTVLLFCAGCIGFGSFLVDSTFAGDDWNLLFQVPLIISNKNSAKRKVSGYVRLNNSGLEDVAIYDGNQLLAETNSQGYYEAMLLFGLPYTLTPQKTNYQFTPPSINVAGGSDDLNNQNFTAKQMAMVTISGNVIWKNSGYVTIPSNPLPLIAVEAYEFTDCRDDGTHSLYVRGITDTHGNYTISVPVGWCGYIEPFWETGIGFFPGRQVFYHIKENQVRNYSTPYNNDTYKITVTIKKPNGDLLPLSDHFQVDLDGIKHANGSNKHTGLVGTLGECYFSPMPHGWIGTVTPRFTGGAAGSYSFNPPSITMNGILHSDMVFTFTATEN